MKKRKLKVTFEIEAEFHEDYTKDSLEILLNESSHCASKEYEILQAMIEEQGCPCQIFNFEVLE